MKKLIYLFFILLSSCYQNRDTKRIYTDLINDLLKSDLKHNDLLILDTKPVKLDSFPDNNVITLEYLEFYSQKGFLKKEDINHILNQVKSSDSFRLDSTKFTIKTMTKDKIGNIFQSMGFDSAMSYLHDHKIFQIGSFSTPLFTIDKSVVIFWAEEWINPLNAHGHIFIYKKEKNKWKLIQSGGTFKS
jgi:hypothetical protein